MYCKYCGEEIDDKALACEKCGHETGANLDIKNDAHNAGFWILGFIIPIAGLILYLVEKDKHPLKAESAGQGALWSVIIGAVISAVSTAAYGCFLGGLLKNLHY